jgi:hypothetical protein
MSIRIGTIVGLGGSWQSGLAHLQFKDGTVVRCENTATVRALEAAFGNVIGPGHTINNETGGHVGQEVYYSTDDFGILAAFTPVDEASPELESAYEKQQAEVS